MRPAPFGRDDHGVTVLVSAVLVLGLLVVVAGTYTATILPSRVEEKEAKHLQEVDEAFARISNALSSDHVNPVKFNTELTLGTELESWFVTTGSSAHLFVHQDAFYQRIECKDPRLLTLGQGPAPGAQFSGPTTKTDVAWLEFARIHIDDYPFRSGATASRTDWVRLEAIKDGRTQGKFEATLDGTERSLRVRVWDGENRLSTDQVVDSGMANPLPSYLLDPMAPLYGFSGITAGLAQPWTFAFTSSTGNAKVFALYRSPNGAPNLIGQGVSVPSPFSEAVKSDALVFKSEPTKFVQQTYALEGGAFILEQPVGEVLRTGSIAATQGSTRWLSLSGLQLDGHGSRTGSNAVQLEFSREPIGRKIVYCQDPKWNATTPYPEAWASAWQRVASTAGAPVGISQGDNWAIAQLKGFWFVEWTEGRIQLDFRP